MDTLSWIGAISGVATALGVLFAGVQLMLSKQQTRTDFEDSLNRDYRDTIRSIPVEAMFGDPLSDALKEKHLADFYRYIDLTNEQVFLRQQGRVSKATWINWADGIRDNMSRPAFASAWILIKGRAVNSFEELRRLEESGYKADPKEWS